MEVSLYPSERYEVQYSTVIKKKTVFVLGAGASNPFGFPTGRQLIHQIIASNPGMPMPEDVQSHREIALLQGSFTSFARSLRQAHPVSIDDFLRNRPDLSGIGKQLIAWHIAATEREQQLLDPGTEHHWLSYLWPKICAPPDEFARNQIAFVNFNYDRCLEHFMTCTLQASFGVDAETAWKAVSRIPIVHPHERVGHYLPTTGEGHRFSEDPVSRTFAPIESFRQVERVAKSIRLYWEEPDGDAALGKRIEAVFEGAFCVVFLGFGFLPSNMKWLWPILERLDKTTLNWRFATTFGMGRQDHSAVYARLGDKNVAQVRDLDLLRDFVPFGHLME